MCLAIPGQVVELGNDEPPFNSAVVAFGGVRRSVNIACVPDATIGDYVLVHAGVAISRVNSEVAASMLATLDELALGDELETGVPP